MNMIWLKTTTSFVGGCAAHGEFCRKDESTSAQISVKLKMIVESESVFVLNDRSEGIKPE